MTDLEREIARQRRRLMRLDDDVARRTLRSHDAVLAQMRANLDKLLRQVAALRRAGEEIPINRLFRIDRFERLIFDLERSTNLWLAETLNRVEDAKREATELAREHARRSSLAALGPAPQEAIAEVAATFSKLPGQQLRQIIENTADGRPLGQLLSEIAPQAVQRLRDTLAGGISQGRAVRDIARHIRAISQIPAHRALIICRTEILRAYRQTSTATFKQTPVVKGWVWDAALDDRTCEICWAMHGTSHPADEPMDSHVNCRCMPIPETQSWDELGFSGIEDTQAALQVEPGPDLFAQLPSATQRAVLGPTKLAAYQDGKIQLADLVRETHHPQWGRGLRRATLAELGLR